MSSASLARAIKLAGKLESKVKQTQNSKRGHHNIVGCALVRFVCFTNALTTSKKKLNMKSMGMANFAVLLKITMTNGELTSKLRLIKFGISFRNIKPGL